MKFLTSCLIGIAVICCQSTVYGQTLRPFPTGLPTCLEDDFRELEKIYDSTGGNNWTTKTGWLTDPNMENWYGIDLMSGGCDIVSINMGTNNLVGNLANFSLPNLTRLILSGNQLTSVPNFNLPNLEEFYIGGTQLTGIPNFNSANLPNIRYFYLGGTQLTSVHNFDLPSLRTLILSNNKLTVVPNFNLPTLIELFLDNNRLTDVPNFNLPNLQTLHLGDNQLTNVANFTLPNLVHLTLQNNPLTTVPNFNLPKLTGLNLNSNQLASVPNFNLPKLIFLNLENNKLASVPLFNSLPELVELRLNSNILDIVPSFILPKLRELRLYYNQLTTVPNFNLPSLTHLYLSHNKLTSVPNFDLLPKLYELNLGANQLVTVPHFNSTNLPYLGYLYLGGNQLTTVPNFSFPNLTYFNLGANQLTSVPNFTLPSLVQCILVSNKLTSLPSFNFPNLTDLELYDNLLTSLPNMTIANSGRFSINLYNNKLNFDIQNWNHASKILWYAWQATDIPVINSNGILSVHSGGNLSQVTFNWYKDNGATPVYSVTGNNTYTPLSSGSYNCKMTHQTLTISSNPYTNLILSSASLLFTAPISCAINDRAILMDLYNATNGANWTNRTNWGSTQPLHTWYGIQTDLNGCVTCIDLDGVAHCGALDNSGVGNHLVGTIPSSLGNLANLQRLSLSNNALRDSIPSNLGNLSNLQWLILYNNQLTGGIPTTLGSLTNLQRLWLANNPLGGTIPTNLSNLSHLRQLWLESNQLTGSIPAAFGQLTSLTYFSVHDNHLGDTIPASLGNLTQVSTFALSNNQLTGNIPMQFSNLTGARHLFFENNQLTGRIPTLFQNLTGLTHLSFHVNYIDSIPDLSGLSGLTHLQADTNRLTFDDILPNLSRNLSYVVQDSIFTETTYAKHVGDALTIDLGIDGAIPSNVYRWFKNGNFYTTTFINKLTFNALSYLDAGIYTCQVTNPNAPLLTLQSRKGMIKILNAYQLDSTLVNCQGGCTPIRWTQSVNNINGYTIRLKFDSTKVMPDIETNHHLGRIIPAPDSVSLFQYVHNGTLVLNISLQGWQNISGNWGDTLICIAWKPVRTAAIIPLSGTVEASIATGGQTTHPIQANIRTEMSGVMQFGVLYQGANAMTHSTPTNPTVVKSGNLGNMTTHGSVGNTGVYLMGSLMGNYVQFKRQSLWSLGMPEIGGQDAFEINLVVAEHPNSLQNVSKLIAMDVNGDGLISAGDLSEVSRRAVRFQRGFRQANSTDTVSWRHFPKSYLANLPSFRISTTFPSDDGIGMSRLRVVKVDSMFRMDSSALRPCDTTTMDIVAILLGDADGNYATVGTGAKGKLAMTVTIDGRHALAIGPDSFKIPIYASETVFGLDVKLENNNPHIQILSVTSDVAMVEKNRESTTNSFYMTAYSQNASGIAANLPIGYLTIQTNHLSMADLGNMTAYLNGQLSQVEVTSSTKAQEGIEIFPNPTHHILTIRYGIMKPATITVLDAIGRTLQVVEPDAEQTQFDMSRFVKGIYFVKVDDKTFKILKQ